MNQPKGNGESLSKVSVKEQAEKLQRQFPDMFPRVFSQVGENPQGIELTCVENVLCCYPNQLEAIKSELPEDFDSGEIVIINLGALRKGTVEYIGGNESKLATIENPVLLSPGVIEYYESASGKKYVETILRDGGKKKVDAGITNLADANERTTTAGRNFSGNLEYDLEVENAEESPFLMRDENGEYFLVTHDLKYKEYLVESILSYLKNKYLNKGDENYEEVKKAFELRFKGVNYDDLGDILRGIIEHDRFAEYTWENGEIEELDNTNISLNGQVGTYYVYHDRANNTIEYRAIRRITGFPKGLKAVGRIPLRLFLESENNGNVSLKKIENIGLYGAGKAKLVPTINDVSQKVNETINS